MAHCANLRQRSKPDGRDAKRLGAEHESAATRAPAAGAQPDSQNRGKRMVDNLVQNMRQPLRSADPVTTAGRTH